MFALCRQRVLGAFTVAGPSAQFSTSATVLSRPGTRKRRLRKNESPIRVKSKAAIASRERRKERLAALDFQQSEKLDLSDAVSVLRAVQVASPNAMYELFIKTRLGNGITVPKGRFKLPRAAQELTKDRVVVFAEGKHAVAARKAGADIVGGLELIDQILNGKIRATTYLSAPDMIKAITPKLGRFLGPQGLMPSDRRGTVLDDFETYFTRLKGTSQWKADKFGHIRVAIGRLNFPVADVVKNFRYMLQSVKEATGNVPTRQERNGRKRPVTVISKVMLSSTQGPGIRIADF